MVDLSTVEKDLELANKIAAQINPLAGLVLTGIRGIIELRHQAGLPTQEYEAVLTAYEAARATLKVQLDEYDRLRAEILGGHHTVPGTPPQG